eukprot:6160101-Amphidinium_carterae.1
MSGFDADRHTALLAATAATPSDAFPKLPWEEDWIAPLFGGGSLPWEQSMSATALSSVPVPLTSQVVSTADEGVSTDERPLKRMKRGKSFAGWSQSDQNHKSSELVCWVDIALELGSASRVAQQMLAMSSSGASRLELSNFLAVITSDREVNTLTRHRSSLNVLKRQIGVMVPTEDGMFQYLRELLGQGAPKTRAVSALKALMFLQHVFEVLSLKEVTASRRVLAAVTACKKMGPGVESKDPLSVSVVQALEYRVLDSAVDTQERLMAGLVLLCVYTRCRWHEVQRAFHILPDAADTVHGFVELTTSTAKGLKSELKGNSKLAIVAPAIGVTGVAWALCWLGLRAEQGFPLGHDYPLLPMPLDEGKWGTAPIPSSVGSAWVRHFVKANAEPNVDVSRFSSHSCKVTCLSWASKFGLQEELRSMLGYHRWKHNRSTDLYARDAQAPALRGLMAMLGQIRAGWFAPDETRSGRFINAPSRIAGERVEESGVPEPAL